ncbi:MDR family MFS transporter [Bifidobacterium sp. ESL0800]|uniref:MDR family MFS transporter n=1 Tax=Bifidobacterium sp. ESL0800 TaxID=2983236 RepID=UPI0023F8AD1E|nr:MDR family MFS transporter [Bifidobacterium sp. ESL0800]WEV75303.1 MDR family MFS transporter [Bifidobacterium sp. ESL0800]
MSSVVYAMHRAESADAGEQTRPGRPSKRDVTLVFIGLMVTMLMSSLSQTVLSTAMPTIVGDLGGVDRMTWVITGYGLALTVMMPVYGRISDLFGRKPLLLIAIALFMCGSAVGGLAGSMNLLVTARVIQGLGGGGLMILSQSAIADVVPARERGKYMGVMGAVFAVSSVAGPLIGGWLTSGPGWRWAFWINLPLGVLALAAVSVFLHLPKPSRENQSHIDYFGMALIAAITVIVVLVCTNASKPHTWNWAEVIVSLAVLIAAFIAVELKVKEPVMPMNLFRNSNFDVATLGALLIGVAMFGVLSYLPTYIQMTTGVTATQAGLLMSPMMASVLVTSIASGALVSKTGKYKVFPIVGTSIMAVGLVLLSTLKPDSPIWMLCLYTVVFGLGLGLGQQILMLIVQDAFPASIVGTATASFNYFKQVGATIGTAIVGGIFTSRLTGFVHDNLATAMAHMAAAGAAGSATAGAGAAGAAGAGSAKGLAAMQGAASHLSASNLTPSGVNALPDMLRTPIVDAYNSALLPIFLWMVPFMVAAVLVFFFVRQKELSTTIER